MLFYSTCNFLQDVLCFERVPLKDCFASLDSSINHPGCLFNFGSMRVGIYSRWVLIRGQALIIFPTLLVSEDIFRA